MNLQAAVGLLRETFQEWKEDKVSRLAAALAYFTIFSIAPLLLIAIAIIGLVFGDDAAQGTLVGQLQELVGPQVAGILEGIIANAQQDAAGVSIINLAVLLFAASGVFAQLQDALNTVWDVEPMPGQGLRQVLQKRLLSFGMVLGIGLILLLSLAASAALTVVTTFAAGLLPGFGLLWQLLNFAVSLGVITLLFAVIYKFLPDAKIAWGDVWIGAVVTALLFAVGNWALGVYFGNAGVGSAYGAAGSLVVLLIWIFYSAQILLIGAEFTQVYARRYGSRIEPTEHAVKVTEEDQAEEGIPRTETVEAAAQRKQARQSQSSSAQDSSGDSGLLNRFRQRFSEPEDRRRRRQQRRRDL